MFNDRDFSGDSGMQVDTGAASTNPALVERVPTNRDAVGNYYDQDGRAMTIAEVKAYLARHNINLVPHQ